MSASMKTFEEMIEERANFLWDRDLGPKGNKEHYDKKAHDELILEYAAKNPEMIKPPADGAKECAMQIFDECISAGNTFRIDEAAKLIDIYCRTQPAAAAVQGAIEALESIRVFVQDCLTNSYDNASIGNLMASRDECDKALAMLRTVQGTKEGS